MNIAHAILMGESAAIVGKRYGLSATSCMSILRVYCWRLDPLICKSLRIYNQDVPLQILREYSDTFFNIEKADDTITMDSPIWKVKEFNNTIVKALLCSNINTMRDLSIIEETDLKKIPMIGPKSIKKIIDVLQIQGE